MEVIPLGANRDAPAPVIFPLFEVWVAAPLPHSLPRLIERVGVLKWHFWFFNWLFQLSLSYQMPRVKGEEALPRVSGTYSLPPSYRATAGQTIRTSQHNPPLEDIAQALTGSLPRDGSAAMSGNLPMNDRRITNLGAATAASDAVRLDQIVNEPNAGNLLVVNGDGTGVDYQDPSDFAASGDIAALTETVNNAAPPGAVMHFARNTAPTGWLECNGENVSRTTYAALFSAIGTTFGSGNGTTTFGLPDMRGEFIRGWDNGRGVDSGRSFGSTQSDAYKSHTHNVNITIGTTDTSRVSGVTDGGTGSSGYSTTAQSSGGSETRPRNIALLVCIKT